MDKEQFLQTLRQRLAYLPAAETESSVAFYEESLNDRIEDGMTEEEAVAALGSLDDIVKQIERSLPVGTLLRERLRTDREQKGGIWLVLAIVGSPLWLPLLLAAASLALCVYLVLWACIVSLFSVLLALAVSGVALVLFGLLRCFSLGLYLSLMIFGLALCTSGLALLLYRPCLALSRALVSLSVRFGRWLKGLIWKGGKKA